MSDTPDEFAGLRPEEAGSKLQALYELTKVEETQIKARKKLILEKLRALEDGGDIPALSGHFAAEFKRKAWYPFEPVFSLLMDAGYWDPAFGMLKAKEIDELLVRLPQDLQDTIWSHRVEFDKDVSLRWEHGPAGKSKTRKSIFGGRD